MENRSRNREQDLDQGHLDRGDLGDREKGGEPPCAHHRLPTFIARGPTFARPPWAIFSTNVGRARAVCGLCAGGLLLRFGYPQTHELIQYHKNRPRAWLLAAEEAPCISVGYIFEKMALCGPLFMLYSQPLLILRMKPRRSAEFHPEDE